MRIAVVLSPMAPASDPQTWLREVVAQDAAVVVLPGIDPLARALAAQLTKGGEDPTNTVVLARASAESIGAQDCEALGLAARTRRLEPVEDPAIEGAIAEGAAHLDAGDLARAKSAYSLAESLLSWDYGPRRAEVLVNLAAIEARAGDPVAAIALLDRALAISPDHQTALRARIDLARSTHDAATAAALRRRLLRRTADATERAELLSSIADESLTAASEALREALSLRPRDPRLLERLQATLEAAGRWTEAVNTKVALAETIPDPRDRARAFTAAAGMCARRTNDVARSVALYEAAIADDPSAPGAFEAIEAVLLKNEDHAGLERAYVRQLERLAETDRDQARGSLLDRLATLRHERLGDTPGAIVALDQLVMLNPNDVDHRRRLAALLEQTGEPALAATCLEAAAVYGPTNAETFRDLHRVCSRLGDADRSYCACAVLVHLGEADVDEQAVYRTHAPETTPRPSAALDAQGWHELHVAEYDEVVSHIVHAIAPAAIATRIEQLRAAGHMPDTSRFERLDVEKSTLTAARTVGWTCAVLGIPVPQIFALGEMLPGGIVALPTPEPVLLLGKSMLSGRSVPELCFAVGRELASQHLTARMTTFYPTVPELRPVLIAAVSSVMGEAASSRDVQLRQALQGRLDVAHHAELARAVQALQARDGRFDLKAWMRSIEMTACRAGLLACGDVTAAARMLAVDGRVIGGLSAADRIRDLVPFSVSERYARARRALGIGARVDG